jgi:glycosyltransferase involved in cell wall biosynthesis
MKIGIIYYGVHPFNRGIDQLAQNLKKIGHSPEILTRSESRVEKQNFVNGIPIIQVPKSTGNKLADLKLYHFPYNPFWKKLIVHYASQKKWQALIVRETPLSYSAIQAGKKLGVPVFLDMRENLSAMYKYGKAKNFFVRLFRNSFFVSVFENMMVCNYSHVFTVSAELKEWMVRSYNVLESNITVMENVPSEQFLKIASVAVATPESKKKRELFRMVYAGWITEQKGLGDVVKCLPMIIKKQPSIRLRIIGDGPYLKVIKNFVKKHDLDKFVEFYPMLSQQELIERLAECDLGLETCWPNELTNLTLPGKLFEYFAIGLPVLTSDRKPVARIINKTDAGYIYRSRDAEKLSKIILNIATDRKTCVDKAMNASVAMKSSFNWNKSCQKLKAIFN